MASSYGWGTNEIRVDTAANNGDRVRTMGVKLIALFNDLFSKLALDLADATAAKAGLVELATAAEAQAGTDASRAVTPAALAAAMTSGTTGASSAVQCNLSNSTKYYMCGTTRTSSGTGALTFDTGIYTSTASGCLYATRVYNAVYNDYAEFFPRKAGDPAEAGDIIALDESSDVEWYSRATAGSLCVAGVCSGEFAHIIGGDVPGDGEDFIEMNLKRYIPVALAGRVHVKVKGSVARGDWIVPSESPGVGRAAGGGARPNNSVGVALGGHCGEETGLVRLLVRG